MGSEDSLEAYDLREEPDERDAEGKGPPGDVAGLIKGLRKGGEDPSAVVNALRAAPDIVRWGPAASSRRNSVPTAPRILNLRALCLSHAVGSDATASVSKLCRGCSHHRQRRMPVGMTENE